MKFYKGSIPSDLKTEIENAAIYKEVPAGSELLREGQYVKVLPVVKEGLIKVFTRYEDRELLLYYIQPEESCIMSFAAGLYNDPSQIYAVTESDSKLHLLPIEKVRQWVEESPAFGSLFLNQYKYRYSELLSTIHHVLFNKLDVRLYEHLRKKAELKQTDLLSLSHQQLANELGTVREVISRTMKKLEAEGLVQQEGQQIRVSGD